MASNEKISKLLDQVRAEVEAQRKTELSVPIYAANALRSTLRDVEGPEKHLGMLRLQPLGNMCQLMALEMGLIGAIVNHKPNPITSAELARITGRDQLLITRVMRLLAAHGLFEETSAEAYRSNAFTEALNTRSNKGATRNMTELLFPIAGTLPRNLRQAGGFSQFSNDHGGKSPFEFTYGESMFGMFNHDPEQKKAFDHWMEGRRTGTRKDWIEVFPVHELAPSSGDEITSPILVDIGGGRGHDVGAFQKRFPHTSGHVILQELPETLSAIENPPEGVKLMQHNFFQEQPIKGAMIYFMRGIIHDWSDERSLTILGHVSDAMSQTSLLLIEEIVVADKGADWVSASIDILMMMEPGGIERTESHWQKLLESAGLDLRKIWRAPGQAETVLEIRKIVLK